MNVEVRKAEWPEDADRLRAVRQVVFVEEQSVDPDIEWDGLDERCDHVLTLRDGTCIGTGRLMPDGRIGRMAVLKNCRGEGHGGAMLEALVEIARHRGLESVHLHAQVHALDFYERHGFVADGEVFDEAGIDHRNMVRRL